jgi:hypothetical protein
MNITLQRTLKTSQCTEGKLSLDSTVLYSMELPWVPEEGFPGGRPDKSCVPAGEYQLELHDTPKHPKTFALVNPSLGVIHEYNSMFPNYRTACLIHVANYPDELEGCIGLGKSQQYCFIGESNAAIAEFKEAIPWTEGHTLTIIDPKEPTT